MTYDWVCMLSIHSDIINSNFNSPVLQHFLVIKLLLPPKLSDWKKQGLEAFSVQRVVGRVFEVNLPIQPRAPLN